MKRPLTAKNLVLLFCGLRTGHFGQGTFIHSLLPYFAARPGFTVTLIKTDCADIAQPSAYQEYGMQIIAIPHLQNTPILTGENSHYQKALTQRIIGIIYPYLKDKANLLFWANSVDYLNLCQDLKQVFPACRILYVHHSFSWKYFRNVPDEVFGQEWKKGNDSFHPKAFEMTRYQQQMALVSDMVITVTHHARDFFVKVLDIPSNKVVTIYNGRPVPGNQTARKQALRKKYGFNRTEKILLFSGRLTKDKGFPDLLRALKLVADKNNKWKLVVLGAGGIFEYTALIDPHWSKIIYTGELEQEQVSHFYQLADIGVIPSLHEQCSFTAIEMRLHKLPVIVSGVDGLDELFAHGHDSLKLTLQVNKAGEKVVDEKEFAAHIEKLLTDRKLANQLVRNAYKKGKKLFGIQKMRERYEQVFTYIFD